MTKSELIETVANKSIPSKGKLSKKEAEEVVNCIFDSFTDSLLREERIEIRGFGSFTVKHYKPYVGRNPKTGETVKVKEKKSIHFKVGKDLKERVNRG